MALAVQVLPPSTPQADEEGESRTGERSGGQRKGTATSPPRQKEKGVPEPVHAVRNGPRGRSYGEQSSRAW